MNTIDATYEEAEAESIAAHAALRKASKNVLHIREELAGNTGAFNPVGRQPATTSKAKMLELLDEAEEKELEAEELWLAAVRHLEEVEEAMMDEQ
jgi:hypothetical protein